MPELTDTSVYRIASMKAYYKLESGALTTDSSGNSKTLTNNNSVGSAVGLFGGAADYGTSNTNKNLRIAENLGIIGENDISISFWMKLRTEIGSGRYIISAFITNTGGLDRYMTCKYEYNTGTIRIGVDSSGSNTYFNGALGTADWNHFVFVRDLTGTAARIYKNGVQVATGTNGTSTATGDELVIGNNVGATTEGVPAYLDDFAIFNSALTATQVAEIYNAKVADISIF